MVNAYWEIGRVIVEEASKYKLYLPTRKRLKYELKKN
jgi:hypothetical protein